MCLTQRIALRYTFVMIDEERSFRSNRKVRTKRYTCGRAKNPLIGVSHYDELDNVWLTCANLEERGGVYFYNLLTLEKHWTCP